MYLFYIVFRVISSLWLLGWAVSVLAHFLKGDFAGAVAALIIWFISWLIIRFLKKHLKNNLKFNRLSKELKTKPSSEAVRKYIQFFAEVPNDHTPPSFWANVRAAYMSALAQDDIPYDLKVELFEALKIIGTRGIPYPKKSQEIIIEERKERIQEAGEKGERDVEHALEWLDQERFTVYSDISLAYQGRSQQFDTVIVGDNGIFNIETKNFTGDLEIHEDGNWYRVSGETKVGTENVNFQVRRHNKVLSSVLEDQLPIVDLIVWTNIASVLEGIENSPTKIIKVDQLVDFVEDYDEGKNLSEKERAFAKKAIKDHIKTT